MSALLLSLLACGAPTPDACAEGYVRSEQDDHCVAAEITPEPGDTEPDGEDTSGGAPDDTADDSGADTGDAAPEQASSTRADLRLKRWRQISLDLQGALELSADEICKETGLYDCSTLHAVALGGISVDNGVFRHPGGVGATTGLAVERVAMQSCFNRLEKDRAGDPVVFSHVDLAGAAITEDEAAVQVQELYRRLLARDPLDAEIEALYGLHAGIIEDGGANADWALMTCFTLATTTEALTY